MRLVFGGGRFSKDLDFQCSNPDAGRIERGIRRAVKQTERYVDYVERCMAIALCCDIRIASDDSRFAVPAAKLGLGYAAGGIERLMQIVGPSFAMEIFYTARQFDATEALTMGLVNRVVPRAELDDYCDGYTGRISENAPLTIRAVKTAVGENLKPPSDRDLALCDAQVAACFASQDYIEGRTAFMEKRKPQFTGT